MSESTEPVGAPGRGPRAWGRQRLALMLSASVFMLPYAVGRVLEIIVKAINPDNVDVTNGLAYLRPLVYIGIALYAVMLVATVLVLVRLQRSEGRGAARAPWVVLITQVVLPSSSWPRAGSWR